ncbi:hypothetical protein PHLGIDRAFT_180046 [Phlebiopsis gigantea 11061_1 CR5-6]|uniref:YebC-like protein n=1 Tax=Phlebiopsis gigantea (strain 11061_1 CR5-6) TaxID=745531 RepID=A0A0C3RUP0_PHLG1|nr:hypothetical protein PHLGIDRAFT_180046 [Phlebiopsis gigantea 11061_1 CR5-6]
MNALRIARRLSSPRLERSLSTSSAVWSGHNKWSKIKHKKGANDLKKGELYGRASRDILLAIRQGGSADPEANSALAAVVRRARSQGVPKDNIETCIKKAVAKGSSSNAQAVTYEAMKDSVGIIIECLSDNASRTVLKMRETLGRQGAHFAPVAFLFHRKGSVRVAVEQGDDLDERLETLINAALEAGAEDFEQLDAPESEGVVEMEVGL